MLWQRLVGASSPCTLLIRCMLMSVLISHQGFIDCLGYPFGDHSLFTRQASKSTANDSVSRTGLLESRQTSARSKSGDTQL
jgi:hypothetical protein